MALLQPTGRQNQPSRKSEMETFGPPVVMGDESLMCVKAHGTSASAVQEELRWGCDALLADDICNFNRHGAEPHGYWLKTRFRSEAGPQPLHLHDSNSGRLLFTVNRPSGRGLSAFLSESKAHGWPSFRDDEVNWREVRVLPGGETVSKAGTHLGHNLPDKSGNRYCINLVSVAGWPRQRAPWCSREPPPRRLQRHHIPPNDPENHYILRDNRMRPPFPPGVSVCAFGAGCFWGAEKGFWRLPGVYSTAVGFCGGSEQAVNPSYMYVCTGDSGHCEAVQVVWDPARISFADLLRHFWNCHDPTQGDRQGADRGSQYRSGVYCVDEVQAVAARASLRAFDAVLRKAGGFPAITTEVRVGCPFWYAELCHQQYLAKPASQQYCSAEPTGLVVPPFEAWDLAGEDKIASRAARGKYQPKLPPAFWNVYDASIQAPNLPVELDMQKIRNEAIELRDRIQARSSFSADIERQHVVVIRYCRSCGYERRAIELAGHLQRTCGVRVGMIQDIVTSGAFDVKVKRAKESRLSLVHSKKGGNGFVDTAGKVVRIVQAIIAADPEGEAARSAQATLDAAARFAGIADDGHVRAADLKAEKYIDPVLPASGSPYQPPSPKKPALLIRKRSTPLAFDSR